MSREQRGPNEKLGTVLALAGISNAGLARRVNDLGAQRGLTLRYDKTSVARWVSKGMVPQGAAPHLIAAAIGSQARPPGAAARDRSGGRRSGARGRASPSRATSGEAVQLGHRAVPPRPRRPPGGQRRHLAVAGRIVRGERVRDARLPLADNPGRQLGGARRRDPGGGLRAHRCTSATAMCRSCGRPPRTRAAGTPSTAAATGVRRWCRSACGWTRRRCCSARTRDEVGRALFGATAELTRLAGWMAFDTGQQEAAQRYYIQALRLARAAADVPLGGYVLASMSLQATYRGFADEGVDLAQAALERNRGLATARTMSFFRLVEARAHAKAGDAPAARGRAEGRRGLAGALPRRRHRPVLARLLLATTGSPPTPPSATAT